MSKKGFTLMEILLAIALLLIFAALALPKYYRVYERAIAAEGGKILIIMHSYQKLHKLETGDYYTGNFDATTLGDIAIPASSNFTNFQLNNPPFPQVWPIARIQRLNSTPAYWLWIAGNGNIACSDGIGGSTCKKLGFGKFTWFWWWE